MFSLVFRVVSAVQPVVCAQATCYAVIVDTTTASILYVTFGFQANIRFAVSDRILLPICGFVTI